MSLARCRCQFPSTQAWLDYMDVMVKRQRRYVWGLLVVAVLLAGAAFFFHRFHRIYIFGLSGSTIGLAWYYLVANSKGKRLLEFMKTISDKMEALRQQTLFKVRAALENDRERNLFDWLNEVTSNQATAQVIIWTLTGLFAANPSGNFWEHIETVRRIQNNVAATKPEEEAS